MKTKNLRMPIMNENERNKIMSRDADGVYISTNPIYAEIDRLTAENKRLSELLHKCIMGGVFFSSDLVDEVKRALKEY